DLRSRFGDDLDGVVVQKMVPGKVEMVVGATLESTFGHVVAFGTGGTMVELMDDVSFRLHPISDLNIEDMLGQVRGTRLIRGFRGSLPLDETAVREVLERVSQMIELVPEIHEMDINPLKVLEKGAVAVDWRIRVAKTIVRRSRRINY
ncbi:MAG: acetate--CoA ligase family protein, partial [Thermoanaerobaculia bacterium]